MVAHDEVRAAALGAFALFAALALPASAAAAPFGELPFQHAPAGTTCLAATGAPGELSRWAEAGMELLAADANGLGHSALVPFGELPGCPRVAADPSGAAVAAAATENALRVALREPGGAGFGAPLTLAAADNVYELSVAVSPSGDAVVAWAEYAFNPRRVRIRMARRDAGAAFGAPMDLVPWRAATGSSGVLAAMAADGEAVVLVREPSGTAHDRRARTSCAAGPGERRWGRRYPSHRASTASRSVSPRTDASSLRRRRAVPSPSSSGHVAAAWAHRSGSRTHCSRSTRTRWRSRSAPTVGPPSHGTTTPAAPPA